MNRRNFLKGTFGGAVAGGIILRASDADIAAFADTPGEIVHASKPEQFPDGIEPGLFVFNHKGEPIGVITSVNRRHDAIDVTSCGDLVQQFITGSPTIDLSVRVYGPVQLQYMRGAQWNRSR